jgi:hypothetical protein
MEHDISKEQGAVVSLNPHNKRRFTIQYNDIMDDTRLTIPARFLYLVLTSYVWNTPDHKGVFPGQERLAAQLGLNTRSVRTYLSELEASGLVVVTQRGWNRTNSYGLTDTIHPEYKKKPA